MAVIMRDAATVQDYQAFAALIRDYVDWFRARYAHDKWIVDAVFGHQSLASELTALSTRYGPPKGRTLVACEDGEIHGAVAYHRLSDSICEMKRLFVSARFHGRGTGRRLAAAVIDAATADGFSLMRLDTARLLTEAIELYRSLGFRECAPYKEYPAELMAHIVFMERPLGGGETPAA